MNKFTDKLLSVLLLPAGFYKRISNRKTTLYMGILVVGLFDLFLPDFIKLYKQLFTAKSEVNLQINILIAIATLILLGIVDVVFFSLPLFDIFKFLKKKEGATPNATSNTTSNAISDATPVKAMKIYIISNLMMAPIVTVINYLFFKDISDNSSAMLTNFYIAYVYAILIWSSAIVTRGFNNLFNFSPIYRRLVFIIVFTWNFILGMVFQLQIMNWVLRLFK